MVVIGSGTDGRDAGIGEYPCVVEGRYAEDGAMMSFW